jgi:hypothetical protein
LGSFAATPKAQYQTSSQCDDCRTLGCFVIFISSQF